MGASFNALSSDALRVLEHPSWFRFGQIELDEMLISDEIITLGAFSDDNELMAVSGLFFDERKCSDIIKKLNLKGKVAEIGGCMVSPKFRGNKLMYTIALELVELARKSSCKHIVATAHPDNLASTKSLEKLGMKNMLTMMKGEGYLRNIYLLDL